ncbi:MAG: class I SAM-dependent methyltransferase [Firmicutes bacterium]|uniref:Methyltransferase domain-containing protein n=1 Tax=Sulfobacillus benefaciens TaxID=453960 RepID=A0A2T2WVS9_9FIRM|nr:class I SAM-dependent methyltransferase [Bacillota bacterium]PSR26340.1 MAG: hypothetical protein C7B43_14130 [Sulfobacillus benefaciens]
MDTDQFLDPKFVHDSYKTRDGLATRILSHERYSLQTENVFDIMTRHALTLSVPRKILDIGAGTGAWYQRIRQLVGRHCLYEAVDQSPAMVKQLENRLQGDPKASVRHGRAEAPDESPESFDWVGLHFMLYHVSDISDVLSKAWALVRPGGLLLTGTNGSNSYREMRVYHEQVVRTLGIPYEPPSGIDRFSLANGAQFFPVPVHIVEEPAGLLFPGVGPYLSYYGSGFCWQGIPARYRQSALKEQLLRTMENVVRPHFHQYGHLKLSNSSGYFWARKTQSERSD